MNEAVAPRGDSLNNRTSDLPQRLPVWLRRQVPRGPQVDRVRRVVTGYGLHSVCESAACPNRLECYSKGRVTFMILGDICTRNCGYCKVMNGGPSSLDIDEPRRVAGAASELGLSYVVITSVCRDDLSDGGASQFARTIDALRVLKSDMMVEALIPDFRCSLKALEEVLQTRPTVLNHNVETVPRLYGSLRPQGKYEWSIELLDRAKSVCPHTTTKSGMMLGLGEQHHEVVAVLQDLRRVRCDMVTLGQYMRPSRTHYPVQRYLPPKEFCQFESLGKTMGFRHIAAGPLVRSSFAAETTFDMQRQTRVQGIKVALPPKSIPV